MKLGGKVDAKGASPVETPKALRGVGCGGGPQGKGLVPPPHNFFGDFRVKMAYFRRLLVLNFVFFL